MDKTLLMTFLNQSLSKIKGIKYSQNTDIENGRLNYYSRNEGLKITSFLEIKTYC